MTKESLALLQQLLQLMGMARRAGKVAQGFDAAVAALTQKTAGEIYLAADCAPRTVRNVQRAAEQTGAVILRIGCTREQLGNAIGCPPTGVLALTDRGFAKKARTLVPEVPESIKEETVYDD